MKLKNFVKLTAAIGTSLFLQAAFAQPQELKKTEVAIYSNGTYFTKQEGVLKIKDGQATVPLIGSPLYGTHWLISNSKDAKIVRYLNGNEKIKVNREQYDNAQIASLNIGANVLIYLKADGDKSAEPIKGKLVKVLPSIEYPIKAIVQKADGNEIVNLADVQRLVISGSLNTAKSVDSVANTIRIFFEGTPSSAEVTMVSVRTGMNWTPSYLFKMGAENKGKLIMKGTVEAGDDPIDNVPLKLCIGVPTMRYGMQLDPFIQAVPPQQVYPEPAYDVEYNQTESNAALGMAPKVMATRSVVAPQNYQTQGAQSEDLYFYSTGRVSIKARDKQVIPISQHSLNYDTEHSIVLGDHTNIGANRGIYQAEQKATAGRYLKFKNTTAVPITQASLFVIDNDENALAQLEIPYTPVEGNALLRLSESRNIETTNTEVESSRKERARSVKNIEFDLISATGTIVIENRDGKAAKIKVRKTLTGEVTDTNKKGKSSKGTANIYSLNPVSTIIWEIEIPAGKSETLSYNYQAYAQVVR